VLPWSAAAQSRAPDPPLPGCDISKLFVPGPSTTHRNRPCSFQGLWGHSESSDTDDENPPGAHKPQIASVLPSAAEIDYIALGDGMLKQVGPRAFGNAGLSRDVERAFPRSPIYCSGQCWW